MAIAIKKTGRSEYGQAAKMLVYGEPGAGKTLFGSTAPSPLFINLEAGLMTLASRGVDYVDVADPTDLQEIFIYLRGGKHNYKTVVIDTLDELQKTFIADRLKKERRESMQLQDWGYVGEQMQKALRAYRNLPLNVVFLCHAKTDSDSETGAQIYKPALQGAIGDQIAGYVDLAAYIHASPVKNEESGETEMKRVLRFQSSPRFPHIKDRSGKMPPFYELNLETDFTDIVKTIFGDAATIQESETVNTIETEQERIPQVASGGTGGPARAGAAAVAPSVSKPPAKAPAKAAAKAEVKAEVKEEAPATPFEPKPLKSVKVTAVKETPVTEEAALEAVKSGLGAAVIKVQQNESCADCNVAVDDEDLIDLSKIRFRKVLCKEHFAAANKNK